MDIKDIKDSATLWKLRQDIVLNSMFVSDYKNSLGIDEHDVCDFFDAYTEHLSAIHYYENHGTDDTFWDYLKQCDNEDDLFEYFQEYIQSRISYAKSKTENQNQILN